MFQSVTKWLARYDAVHDVPKLQFLRREIANGVRKENLLFMRTLDQETEVQYRRLCADAAWILQEQVFTLAIRYLTDEFARENQFNPGSTISIYDLDMLLGRNVVPELTKFFSDEWERSHEHYDLTLAEAAVLECNYREDYCYRYGNGYDRHQTINYRQRFGLQTPHSLALKVFNDWQPGIFACLARGIEFACRQQPCRVTAGYQHPRRMIVAAFAPDKFTPIWLNYNYPFDFRNPSNIFFLSEEETEMLPPEVVATNIAAYVRTHPSICLQTIAMLIADLYDCGHAHSQIQEELMSTEPIAITPEFVSQWAYCLREHLGVTSKVLDNDLVYKTFARLFWSDDKLYGWGRSGFNSGKQASLGNHMGTSVDFNWSEFIADVIVEHKSLHH